VEFEYGGRYARARNGRNSEESTCPLPAIFQLRAERHYSPIKYLDICSERGRKIELSVK
jgi:hypothetical protein